MDDRIFSISEGAKYLGVFSLTLRNWDKKGFIRSFRTLGGHRRFNKNELDKIKGINGTGEKLKEAIKRLEQMILEEGNRRTVENIIMDLRNISEKI